MARDLYLTRNFLNDNARGIVNNDAQSANSNAIALVLSTQSTFHFWNRLPTSRCLLRKLYADIQRGDNGCEEATQRQQKGSLPTTARRSRTRRHLFLCVTAPCVVPD